MSLKEIVDLLEFWTDKAGNSYFTKAELCDVLDKAQLALFTDYLSKASTSIRIKEAMAPFRAPYNFTTSDTPAGLITVSAANYMALLDVQVGDEPVPIVNEDERALRLKSQIDPVSATYPIGEITGRGKVQLWPKTPASGTVTYYRRPQKPVYAVTGSGRGAAYDSVNSTQLEWNEPQQLEVATRALASLGINLSEGDLTQYSEGKSAEQTQNLKH